MELNEEYYKKIALSSNETPIPLFMFAEGKGVPKTVYFKWIAKGERDIKKGVDSIYAKFFKTIKNKELGWILKLVESVIDSDKSAQWLLERIWPDVFYDTKSHVAQYAHYINLIESSICKTMLPDDTALTNAEKNVDKFDIANNKGTNYEET